MFIPMHWAQVFFNSLEREGGDIEEGVEILKVLYSWVSSLPGVRSGNSVAVKIEKLIRDGMTKAGPSSPEREIAIRFLLLMIKKNTIGYISSILENVKILLDKKRGIIGVTMEYAFLPGENTGDFNTGESFIINEGPIVEAIKKWKGAAKVELTKQVNPDLIGGYRLLVGDEVIDASIRSQLRKLLTTLQSDKTGLAAGSTAIQSGAGDGGKN